MRRYRPQQQLSIKEFSIPFEADLDTENRWVLLARVIPWDRFADLYYRNFKTNRGAPTKDARLGSGSGYRDDTGKPIYAILSGIAGF